MPDNATPADGRFDCGLIIALKEEFSDKPSFQGFNRTFPNATALTHGNRTFLSFQFVDRDGETRRGIAAVLYGMGPMPAYDVTLELLERFDPSVMVNIGIAGALASHLRVGDVIVAETSDDYEISGAMVDDGKGGYLAEFDGRTYQSYGPFFRSVQQFDVASRRTFEDWCTFAEDSLKQGLAAGTLAELRRQSLVRERPSIEGGSIACGNKVVKSANFAQHLRSRKRKTLAVDMESAGFLMACDRLGERPRLVLKTITDFADSRKEQLDRLDSDALRSWAMGNLFALLDRLLRNTLRLTRLPNAPIEDVLTQGHVDRLSRVTSMCRRQYLKGKYQQLAVTSASDLADFDTLFRHVIVQPEVPADVSLFQHLETIVTRSNTNFPIRVEGEPGTGKSTLLNLLYLWLLRSFEQEATEWFPVYLNLRYYHRPPAHDNVAKARDKLRLDLDLISSSIPESQPFIFILDGVDEFIKIAEPFETLVFDALNSPSWKNCKRVIGVGLNYMPNEEHFRRSIPDLSDAEDTWLLEGLPLTADSLEAFVMAMQQVMTGDRSERVRRMVLDTARKTLRLTSLDLITLSMLLKFVPRRNSDVRTLSSLYATFCEEFLNKHERDASIREAAALAFRYAIKQELSSHDELLPKRHWRLIHRHRLIKDYLVAVHVINAFRQLAKGDESALQDLSCVYPQEINQFSKELFNVGIGIQGEVLRGVERAFKKGDVAARTHACYLAGRVSGVTNIGARKRATRFLFECQQVISDLTSTAASVDRPTLLLERTIYISLAYLKEGGASDIYLRRLMSDEVADDLNRGFHLEYYGDIPFDAQDPQSMAHEDPMRNVHNILPCELAFGRLSQRIAAKLHDHDYGLRDIEVYTLCSLAQHRHAAGVLNDLMRRRLLDLIPTFLEAEVSPLLRPYLRMLSEHLQHPRFHRAAIHGQLYRLKEELRAGWTAHLPTEVRNESVADHMLLAVYLAKVYLPETDQDESKYNKSAVIDMLLFHDIGEYRSGDVIAAEKTSVHEQSEAEAVQYLGACGTYLNVANLSSIVSLHHDFEHSDNINRRIAKDIDGLEFYAQLNRYRNRLPREFVASKERAVEEKLLTLHGRRIFDILREPYRDRAIG